MPNACGISLLRIFPFCGRPHLVPMSEGPCLTHYFLPCNEKRQESCEKLKKHSLNHELTCHFVDLITGTCKYNGKYEVLIHYHAFHQEGDQTSESHNKMQDDTSSRFKDFCIQLDQEPQTKCSRLMPFNEYYCYVNSQKALGKWKLCTIVLGRCMSGTKYMSNPSFNTDISQNTQKYFNCIFFKNFQHPQCSTFFSIR